MNKLIKGDQVIVIAGKDKGKQGQVVRVLGDKIVVKNTIEPLPMIDLHASYRKGQKNEVIELILKILKEQFYMDMF